MTTPADTFRILKRKPLTEIFDTIYKRCDADMSEDQFQRIVESYGYTLEEFYDYEQDYVVRRTTYVPKVA